MTDRADFTEEEWTTVLEGPPSAGMIVVTAARGGTIRETFAIGKAYVEARKAHGASELLDEIVTTKPQVDHTRYRSYDELKQHGLDHLQAAVAALQEKLSQAGFHGGFESRTICPRVRRTSSDATRKEVPPGVDRSRCAVGDRVWSSGSSRRG